MQKFWKWLFPNLFNDEEDPYSQYRVTTIQPQPVENDQQPKKKRRYPIPLPPKPPDVLKDHRKPAMVGGVTVTLIILWIIGVSIGDAIWIGITVVATIIGIFAVLRIIRGPLDPDRSEIEIVSPEAPSKRVKHGLAQGEKLLWESREHPIALWQWWIGGVLLQPAAIALAIFVSGKFAGILWLVGMAAFGIRLFIWDRNKLCITNKRLFVVVGILTIQFKTMPLAKMTDQTAVFPAISNILAWLRVIQTQFATLVVESAGQDQALSRVVYVPDGHRVNKLIMSMVLKEP